jgi:hypothetical protein
MPEEMAAIRSGGGTASAIQRAAGLDGVLVAGIKVGVNVAGTGAVVAGVHAVKRKAKMRRNDSFFIGLREAFYSIFMVSV